MSHRHKLDNFISSILEARRKRTGIIYIKDNFDRIINIIEDRIPNIKIVRLEELCSEKLIISPLRLFERISKSFPDSPKIILNIEFLISVNGDSFLDDIALLFSRAEPLPGKELFLFFYSKKQYQSFENVYELSEFTSQNILEL